MVLSANMIFPKDNFNACHLESNGQSALNFTRQKWTTYSFLKWVFNMLEFLAFLSEKVKMSNFSRNNGENIGAGNIVQESSLYLDDVIRMTID